MLEQVNLKTRLTRAEYERQLTPLQNQLHLLGYQVYVQKRPLALVFEGYRHAKTRIAVRVIRCAVERIDDPLPLIVPADDDRLARFLGEYGMARMI